MDKRAVASMARRLVFVISLVIVAAVALPARAHACVCVATTDAKTTAQQTEAVRLELQKARAVFSGEVVGRGALTVRFKVEVVWKGEIPAEFAMSNGTRVEGWIVSSNTCDYDFGMGGKYLVFAYGKDREQMKAEKCGFTAFLPLASDTVMFLDTLTISHSPVGPNSKRTIAVLGAVAKPGLVEWTEGMTVADAMARAGGYTERAAARTDEDARSFINRYTGGLHTGVRSVTPATRLLESDTVWIGRDIK